MTKAEDTAAIYIVDTDKQLRNDLARSLSRLSFPVHAFDSGEDLLAAPLASVVVCLIAEIELPGMDGLDLRLRLLERGLEFPTILLTRDADVATAVRIMRAGVFDLIEKPVVDRVLIARVKAAMNRVRSSPERPIPGDR